MMCASLCPGLLEPKPHPLGPVTHAQGCLQNRFKHGFELSPQGDNPRCVSSIDGRSGDHDCTGHAVVKSLSLRIE